MQRLEVRGAVRPLYGSLGVKGVKSNLMHLKPEQEHYVGSNSHFLCLQPQEAQFVQNK